ncbi:hypothetical protein HAX54_036187, partial [Datura stramonium]|nr:hypothetical protein [Datura stramonium]
YISNTGGWVDLPVHQVQPPLSLSSKVSAPDACASNVPMRRGSMLLTTRVSTSHHPLPSTSLAF